MMPTIEEVKAAATTLIGDGVAHDSPVGVVVRFLEAILSAPGISAERLAVITDNINNPGNFRCFFDIENAQDLLRDYLRLRAEMEVRQ